MRTFAENYKREGMAKKQMLFKTKGMNRDLSVSAFNPEFSFENMNLRLSSNEGNTQLSWVNEKGTKAVSITGDSLVGIPIGTAVINNKLVVFTTTDEKDYIYKLWYSSDNSYSMDSDYSYMECELLFSGKLGFEAEHPLETLVSYESETVQKVYWVDGKNQPRVINICGDYSRFSDNYDPFAFIPELQLNETVKVKKLLGANGMFAPGVIQYALTYYQKNGQETNIFHTTPLLYTSHRDRGASPDDKVDNAFKITVENIDSHFDYLRIYSIQRTSINGTPIVKRVQDIVLNGAENNTVSYIDTGLSGDTVDPTELLYKGGESIIAETLEQKDNTLFFGGLTLKRTRLTDDVRDSIKSMVAVPDSEYRWISPIRVSGPPYLYYSQLTAYDSVDINKSVPCSTFKYGDFYRLGVQFQDSTGKWSEPIHIVDKDCSLAPEHDGDTFRLPRFVGNISSSNADILRDMDYVKVRGVVVLPNLQDRVTICQGLVNPTLFTTEQRDLNKNLHAQSDWFFRPYTEYWVSENGTVKPYGDSGVLKYTDAIKVDNGRVKGYYEPMNIRAVEVQGIYKNEHRFNIDRIFTTLYSPDIAFDESLWNVDFSSFRCRHKNNAIVESTLSDIDIQTETPTISNIGVGFDHKSFIGDNMGGIVSGLFYDDCAVDDDGQEGQGIIFRKFGNQKNACKWMVYLWNKSGSLNNDIKRPVDKGTQTAILKKKVVSNLRYSNVVESGENQFYTINDCKLFSSDVVSIIKLNDKIYQGNVDTLLMPDQASSNFFAFNNNHIQTGENVDTTFTSAVDWITFSKDVDSANEPGFYRYANDYTGYKREEGGDTAGDHYLDLVLKKEGVRMRYKTTPHLVLETDDIIGFNEESNTIFNQLPIVDVCRDYNSDTAFGGQSKDAFRENNWIPCGEAVRLDNVVDGVVKFYWDYGDTYYQRWDCLKTYPFSSEDENQVVEIGSFMLETRMNIDGRYDRNRGQVNNLNMNPQNFNLLNQVYSQTDNFFTYKITFSDEEESEAYPNQVTWSKTKTNGSDVDAWTNVTLANMLELDGDSGKIRKLIRLNDQLLCFQDKGISQILYNENVQIQSTQGVPIEIANSGKVQGKRYLSNTVGCSNKWSIVQTPAGIYFMDSNEKSIYRLGQGLENVSLKGGMDTWCKQNIPSSGVKWNPVGFDTFRSIYDSKNQDVMFINKETALAFSEKLGTFTSFYSYGNSPFFCNVGDRRIWLRSNSSGVNPLARTLLWEHEGGEYCKFFDKQEPYWMTLVGNAEPQADKIFTDIELRASVEGDGEYDRNTGMFIPTLPFDSIEVWNEYQHGSMELSYSNGHLKALHNWGDTTALNRKFRIWRCDVPRDSFHRLDRMRNPWIYLKLKDSNGKNKTEIHDVVLTYFR